MKCIRLSAVLMALAALAGADTLRLVNGARLQGTFLGADTRQVRFMGPDGVPKTYSISSIAGIDFGGAPPAPQPRPASAPQTAAAAAPPAQANVVIPAGTVITVRMIDGIDSTKTAVNERFRASIDDPVVVGDQVIIPRGADATVQIVTVQENKEMAVKLYDVTVGGKAYPVVAGYAQLKGQGKSKARKAAGRGIMLGGIGAGIGALAGGGRGAAIGAAAGAGLGAISGAAAKGKSLKVPPETRLTFELRSPLPLG